MSYYLKKCCGIYCITHTESGKQYVGQSVDITMRWKHHTTPRKGSAGIKGAIMKHGVAAFTFSVLEECKREELNERESWWISTLGTLSPAGYNMTSGGGQGMTVSSETKKKMSEAKKGNTNSKGKSPSAETRENLREYWKGRKRGPRSAEAREKISVSLSGHTHSDETREKMSAAKKGRTHSDETRAKISAAAKERHAKKILADLSDS
jgi:group I intron endonuclease